MRSSPLRLGRRTLPLVAFTAVAATARAETTSLALTCDTALAAPLRRAAAAYAARTSVRVFVFPTGPGLIRPQLQRDIQNDIVVTQVPILEQIAGDGLAAVPLAPRWHNPLVIAARRGNGDGIRPGVVAAPDPSAASGIDGPAILARLDLRPSRVLGAVDTDEVAFLLSTGAAQLGLLHAADVRAHPELAMVRPVPPEVQAPLIYAASVTKLAGRPNPQGFVAFLATPDATAVLAAAGLEVAAP